MQGDVMQGKGKLGDVTRGGTIAPKNKAILNKVAFDKHSSLFNRMVSNEEEMFITLTKSVSVYKIFSYY
jgi:hypothetical protein